MEDIKIVVKQLLEQQQTVIGEKNQKQQTVQILKHQRRMFEAMLQMSNEPSCTDLFTSDAVANSIGEVLYSPEECVLFLYYRSYEEIV